MVKTFGHSTKGICQYLNPGMFMYGEEIQYDLILADTSTFTDKGVVKWLDNFFSIHLIEDELIYTNME